MKIHLNRAGQSLGTFTPAEVREGYDAGKFLPGDLAWRDGMESWKPLGEVIGEIAPAAADLTAVSAAAAPAMASQGPAWERRGEVGFFNGLFETIRTVLLEPGKCFRGMNPAGGLGAPLFFFVILGTVSGTAAVIYQMVFSSMQGDTGGDGALAAMTMSSVAVGVTIMILPIFLMAGAFISSALMHLSLMILGGARRPFEATFRVACYAGGATSVLQFLPGCGGLMATVWNFVVLIIGLAEVHGIGKGKAALAILLPSLVCCGLLLAAVFGVAASMGGLSEFMQQVAQEANK